MLELGRRIGRQRAHDVIYDAAQASVVESRPFTATLSDEKDVLDNLSADQIETLLDPTLYTGACGLLADRFAAQARSVAADLSGSA